MLIDEKKNESIAAILEYNTIAIKWSYLLQTLLWHEFSFLHDLDRQEIAHKLPILHGIPIEFNFEHINFFFFVFCLNRKRKSLLFPSAANECRKSDVENQNTTKTNTEGHDTDKMDYLV